MRGAGQGGEEARRWRGREMEGERKGKDTHAFMHAVDACRVHVTGRQRLLGGEVQKKCQNPQRQRMRDAEHSALLPHVAPDIHP